MKKIKTADETFRLCSVSINAESGGVCVYYVREGDSHTKQRRADSDASVVYSVDTALALVALAERGEVVEVAPPAPPAPVEATIGDSTIDPPDA